MERHFYRGIAFYIVILLFSSCIGRHKYDPDSYVRPLEIVKLSETHYQHISYLKLKQSHYYPCNGYVYMSDGEAIIFDSPVDETGASQLINFLQQELQVKIKGVIVNHAHIDAAGGLKAFAKANINSYASRKTAQLLAKDSITITHPFEDKQEVTVGNTIVENTYLGPAHTEDNIVSYIPEEKLLYGGCLIKSMNATKGNLEDADVNSWPETVQKIKDTYPDIETVIPGHGGRGDVSLLDYTIKLFTAPTSEQ